MAPSLIFFAGLIVVIGCILGLRLHAFLALLLGALAVVLLTPDDALRAYAVAQGMAPEALINQSVGARLADGFGRTAGQIGIIIAMAAVIGIGMLESGAAERIVRGALRIFGEERVDVALMGSGFFLAIPVFFDTVFFLMIPIARSLFRKTKKNYLLYVLAIVTGGVMAHSLVPPTPGPLFIADAFGVGIGVMVVAGCIVGLLASVAGFLFARWSNRKWEFGAEQLAGIDEAQERTLPNLFFSLSPIVLPLVLITLGTMPDKGALIAFLADKNIALILGGLAAMVLLWRYAEREQFESGLKSAIRSAGVIILITGAGGAFGKMLQQTNIAADFEGMVAGAEAAVLPLAFLLTTLIRTAQGSATVAMITAAGAFSGLATAGVLSFHPVYLAMAIGCGSKPIWWMNDSGFWVVTQMSEMPEKLALKTLTPMSCIMGVVGLIATMIGAWLWPLSM